MWLFTTHFIEKIVQGSTVEQKRQGHGSISQCIQNL